MKIFVKKIVIPDKKNKKYKNKKQKNPPKTSAVCVKNVNDKPLTKVSLLGIRC